MQVCSRFAFTTPQCESICFYSRASSLAAPLFDTPCLCWNTFAGWAPPNLPLLLPCPLTAASHDRWTCRAVHLPWPLLLLLHLFHRPPHGLVTQRLCQRHPAKRTHCFAFQVVLKCNVTTFFLRTQKTAYVVRASERASEINSWQNRMTKEVWQGQTLTTAAVYCCCLLLMSTADVYCTQCKRTLSNKCSNQTNTNP